jgi:hypothetical protein
VGELYSIAGEQLEEISSLFLSVEITLKL